MLRPLLQWFALILLGMSHLATNLAHAGFDENSGCRLVLCFANPKGPASNNDCRKDIEALHRELAKPHPHIPSCEQAKEKGTFYTLLQDNYALCPAGLIDSRQSGYTRKYLSQAGNGFTFNRPSTGGSFFNGDGEDNQPGALACTSPERPKETVACSNPRYGTSNALRDDECNPVTVYNFNKIVWLPYNADPLVADVFVNNKRFHRARVISRPGVIDAVLENKTYNGF